MAHPSLSLVKKRFVVFYWDEDVSPKGGMNDVVGSFDTFNEAGKYLKEEKGVELLIDNNYDIFDTESGNVF